MLVCVGLCWLVACLVFAWLVFLGFLVFAWSLLGVCLVACLVGWSFLVLVCCLVAACWLVFVGGFVAWFLGCWLLGGLESFLVGPLGLLKGKGHSAPLARGAFLLEERSLNFSLIMHRLALAHLALPTSLTSGMTPALLLHSHNGFTHHRKRAVRLTHARCGGVCPC